MELMTSGAFARASGLSRKALRLYEELGLLRPVQVDQASQYRLYAPAQLEQARLVAWLRRLGMPLAAVRAVSTLPPAQAAAELTAYWERIEAETSARRELARFLIGYPSKHGMGTTLTAMLWSGSQLGLVHIGDCRAYLVRDGEVFQITHDHTVVQSLLDDGKITAAEVVSHPQRSLLLKALDADGGHEPDLQLRDARPGDRYLLSSDGLHQVAAADAITRVLLTVPDTEQAASDPPVDEHQFQPPSHDPLTGSASRATSRYFGARAWSDGPRRGPGQPPGQPHREAEGEGCYRGSTRRQPMR